MRIKLQYGLLLLCWWALQGCENAMPEFADPEGGIRFPNASATKSFIYDGRGTKEAVVYVSVQSVGMVKDYDRPLRMVQVEAKDTLNARPGVHYLPIPDSVCYIPAHKAIARIPVTVLNDTSLSTEKVVLRLALEDNEHFRVNIGSQSRYELVLSNLLTNPGYWYYWGTYGPVKHQFLIDISGERWDYDYLVSQAQNYSMVLFWQAKAKKELALENQRRAEAGLGPLREKPLPGEEEGILVEFK